MINNTEGWQDGLLLGWDTSCSGDSSCKQLCQRCIAHASKGSHPGTSSIPWRTLFYNIWLLPELAEACCAKISGWRCCLVLKHGLIGWIPQGKIPNLQQGQSERLSAHTNIHCNCPPQKTFSFRKKKKISGAFHTTATVKVQKRPLMHNHWCIINL